MRGDWEGGSDVVASTRRFGRAYQVRLRCAVIGLYENISRMDCAFFSNGRCCMAKGEI